MSATTETAANVQPVRFLEGEDPLRQPKPGIGLCLLGGGYCAMLFHLGALCRLNGHVRTGHVIGRLVKVQESAPRYRGRVELDL